MVSACIVSETSRVVVWEALWRAALQPDGQETDLPVAVAAVLRGRGRVGFLLALSAVLRQLPGPGQWEQKNPRRRRTNLCSSGPTVFWNRGSGELFNFISK